MAKGIVKYIMAPHESILFSMVSTYIGFYIWTTGFSCSKIVSMKQVVAPKSSEASDFMDSIYLEQIPTLIKNPRDVDIWYKLLLQNLVNLMKYRG